MNMGLFTVPAPVHRNGGRKIRDIIGPELVTFHNLGRLPKLMERYDVLILGIPTRFWRNPGRLGSRLGSARRPTSKVKLLRCRAAINWIGEWFLDALGMLHETLDQRA